MVLPRRQRKQGEQKRKFVQYYLRSIAWPEECQQPLAELEDARPRREECKDQEFHGSQGEYIDGQLAEPEAQRGWVAILSGLEPLEAALLREEEHKRM